MIWKGCRLENERFYHIKMLIELTWQIYGYNKYFHNFDKYLSYFKKADSIVLLLSVGCYDHHILDTSHFYGKLTESADAFSEGLVSSISVYYLYTSCKCRLFLPPHFEYWLYLRVSFCCENLSTKCIPTFSAHLSRKLKWTFLKLITCRLSVCPSSHIFLLFSSWPVSTNGTKQPFEKGIQVCSNEGLRPFCKGNSYEICENTLRKL